MIGLYLGPTRHERSTRLPRSIRRNLNNGGAGTPSPSSSHVNFISFLEEIIYRLVYMYLLPEDGSPHAHVWACGTRYNWCH